MTAGSLPLYEMRRTWTLVDLLTSLKRRANHPPPTAELIRRKFDTLPLLPPAPPPPPPPQPAPIKCKGFKQEKSTYRISVSPSGRARCRRCRAVIPKGETRLEVCAFVRPGRYTLLLRCTAPACIDAPLSAAILSVYKRADRVPVDAELVGSAEAHRVVGAITSAGVDAQ